MSSNGAFPRAELDALHETALLVADRREMPELLRLILTRAAALIGVDDAFLYFLKPDEQTLRIVAGIGGFAAQTGFSSQSHLASVFKRTVGLTPGEYQRSGDR